MIRLSVYFSYDENRSQTLNGISVDIRKGEIVGIIGTSGGKSTTIGDLVGLLKPTHGTLYLDDKDLYDPANFNQLLSWRASIAPVPQQSI